MRHQTTSNAYWKAGIAVLLILIANQAANAQSGCIQSFRNPQSKYSYNEAKPGTAAFPLAYGEPLGPVSYKATGETESTTLEGYLGKFCTMGFLVLYRGQIVFEQYLQGVKPDDKLLSASMSKSILSQLIGVAISEGKIRLDERVVDVFPDFAGSAFGNATVEELLRMTSGVALKNSYAKGATSDNAQTNPMISPRQDIRAYLLERKELDKDGKHFDYNGAVTALLGLMLSARTGETNTDYLHRKIWMPMGAESSGYWIKNFKGEEGVQGQFVATLRDYGRIGLMVKNMGKLNGQQVIPASWISQMTELRKDKPQPAQAPYYGLHIWIPQAAGGRSIFTGTNGQRIFIDPIADVVIVHMANSPDAVFNGSNHLYPLRNAIVKKLSGM